MPTMSRVSLRFVDVQITEEQFAGDDRPLVQIPNTVALSDYERIVSIVEWRSYSGTLGSMMTLHARVWIASS